MPAVVQRKEEEMLKDLEMMQRENNQLVQPQLQRLNDEIIDSKEECARYDATAAKLAEASAEIQGKIEALQRETSEAEEEKRLLMAELSKLRGDPARLKYVAAPQSSEQHGSVARSAHAACCPPAPPTASKQIQSKELWIR